MYKQNNIGTDTEVDTKSEY